MIDLAGTSQTLRDAPVWMTMRERLVVYATVLGLGPMRCLEIGTFRGGSSLIIVKALDDLGAGTLVCVDPSPKITPADWGQIEHRATLIVAGSPNAIMQARESADGQFDFVLIDGDHSRQGVVEDIDGVIPVLAPNACLLFHDAHYFEVADAIQDAMKHHDGLFTDCGLTCTEETADPDGGSATWGGLRLLRFRGGEV